MNRGADQSRISRRIDHIIRSAVVVFLAIIITGCASIDRFAVTPRTACRGDAVTASWSVQGDARLKSDPSLSGTGRQPATGRQRFVVSKDTRFKLITSTLFDRQTAAVDVMVAPPEHTYGAIAQCSVNQRLISTQFRLGDQLSRQLRIKSIDNPLDRSLRVSKRSRTILIEPHAENATFRGMPVSGIWQLASPLKPGEACTSAMQALRQRLQMHITLQCGD